MTHDASVGVPAGDSQNDEKPASRSISTSTGSVRPTPSTRGARAAPPRVTRRGPTTVSPDAGGRGVALPDARLVVDVRGVDEEPARRVVAIVVLPHEHAEPAVRAVRARRPVPVVPARDRRGL